MAIQTNTTKSINRTSNALGKACDKTQKEIKKLMLQAGCAEDTKIEKVTLPMIPGSKDDVVYVGLNCVDFYFRRGESVQMPTPVANILRNTGKL